VVSVNVCTFDEKTALAKATCLLTNDIVKILVDCQVKGYENIAGNMAKLISSQCPKSSTLPNCLEEWNSAQTSTNMNLDEWNSVMDARSSVKDKYDDKILAYIHDNLDPWICQNIKMSKIVFDDVETVLTGHHA
jgi:hypothetical protein